MTLHVTPDMAEAAYELLRVSPPFRGWKLPPGDEIEFHVTRTNKYQGEFLSPNRIRVSAARVGSFGRLLVVIAHEMVHLHIDRRWPRDQAAHGWRFKRCAQRVCRVHAFDPVEF